MAFLAKFERNFLFGLTRSLALCFIFITLAALIISGLVIGVSQLEKEDISVAPREVIDNLKPISANDAIQPETQQQENSASSQSPSLPSGLKIPFVLQKHFSSPDNLRTLNNWLEELPEDQRQPFLNEMAEAVTEAEKEQIEPLDAINAYHKLKMEKLQAIDIAKEKQKQTWLWYAGAVGLGVIIIALFSLILVLLAIERNTRRAVE
jgi:hypothetical protein